MAIEDFDEVVYKVRCPACGHFYSYRFEKLKFKPEMILGYTECPLCHAEVPHTSAVIENNEDWADDPSILKTR